MYSKKNTQFELCCKFNSTVVKIQKNIVLYIYLSVLFVINLIHIYN